MPHYRICQHPEPNSNFIFINSLVSSHLIRHISVRKLANSHLMRTKKKKKKTKTKNYYYLRFSYRLWFMFMAFTLDTGILILPHFAQN